MAATGHDTSDRSGPVVELRELHKHYGQTHALDGISFSARAGEVFGLLGGGFIVLPIIVLASVVLVVDSGFMAVVLDILPVSQGARLLFDGVSPQEPFATGAVAWLVLGPWTVAGFALLTRIAGRRDA